MKKKGELTINYLIITILALIVLFAVAIIFHNQIINILSSLKVISSGLGQGAETNVQQLVTP